MADEFVAQQKTGGSFLGAAIQSFKKPSPFAIRPPPPPAQKGTGVALGQPLNGLPQAPGSSAGLKAAVPTNVTAGDGTPAFKNGAGLGPLPGQNPFPVITPKAPQTGFVLGPDGKPQAVSGGQQAMDAIDRADASGQTPMRAPPPAQSQFDPNRIKIDSNGNLVKSAPGDMSQEALIRQLEAAAAGIGGQGSLAQQQLQAAGARAQGQAFGGAQGVREVGFGARARTGTDAMGQISGDTASQSQILGLQEQQAARAQLAEALQAQRQQDLTQQTQGTQFQQDLGQFGDAFENAQTKNSYDQAMFNQDIMNQLADAAQAKKITDLNLQSAQSDRIAGGIGGLAATASSMASSGKNYSATQNTPNQGTGGPYDNTAKSNPNEWNPWPK